VGNNISMIDACKIRCQTTNSPIRA